MTNDLPKAAIVAWYNLQAALAAKQTEDLARGYAPTQPLVRDMVLAARERADRRHAKVAAWIATLEAKQ